ncbi:hypothetical protein M2175_005799 [Bradyrhizobium elkanii]|uniref:hypothetical protein n=1 Tax=Bradyrhizobium TaxID=374 RepID=UPI0021670A46|nr:MULTISPECIES: hypothetical protein [Bradyrhizobium]MCS3930768.1 hypothetical protein [Bradyrhizobium elkanii]MCS3971325.1 hypothetical protein [Bradyrhizobium japonicum]
MTVCVQNSDWRPSWLSPTGSSMPSARGGFILMVLAIVASAGVMGTVAVFLAKLVVR